ncbi:ABC transporter permease [Enterococcus sp. 669A]|uniref:ABC transporter permease n=1 Tax=Candidatus Enterococcus moelleringii TaxID=2815325 RepID=A0ABS3L9Y6_9ENTE|nr:ABC transporter permease [Enterococcus sp. 669A]MBO1305566.1 ABC transporter permease [Enterococcus sp. 669A]
MRELLRNHLLRAQEKSARLLMMVGLIVVAFVLALFLNKHTQATLNIAVVGDNPITVQSDSVKITELKTAPPKSELIAGSYDAVVDFSKGTPKITTLKNQEFKDQLQTMLSGGSENMTSTTKKLSKASRILGYILMFLLMAGVTNTFVFTEDKEQHLMERMIASGLSQGKLFISYVVFLFSLLFIPTFLIFILADTVFSVNLGMSLANYGLLIGIICLIGTSFALCNAAFFKDGDQASMIGSMILVITSLVSGSFFSLSNEETWWNGIIKVLPQKQFLQLVEYVSGGESFRSNYLVIVYLLVLSGIFLLIAITKNRRTYLR